MSSENMGCTSSKETLNKIATNDAMYKAYRKNGHVLGPKPFTADEIILIKRTWNFLAKDMQGNGLQVFLRIFELCPSVKTLFFVQDIRHTEIAKNVSIQAHGERFMNAIGAVVETLGDTTDTEDKLPKLLILLGQLHRKHKGFKTEYFECFYEALMWQWEHRIGKEFVPEVSNAWSHLFIYVMEKLLEGYRTHS